MEIRDAVPADMERILELNNVEAEAVNALREDSLAAMCGLGFAVLVAGKPAEAFLLAFSHQTPAQGPNHAWFLARETSFVYVDRVVVSPSAQRQGLARRLYAALEARARAARIAAICCEVNLLPANLPVLRFTSASDSRRLERRRTRETGSECATSSGGFPHDAGVKRRLSSGPTALRLAEVEGDPRGQRYHRVYRRRFFFSGAERSSLNPMRTVT